MLCFCTKQGSSHKIKVDFSKYIVCCILCVQKCYSILIDTTKIFRGYTNTVVIATPRQYTPGILLLYCRFFVIYIGPSFLYYLKLSQDAYPVTYFPAGFLPQEAAVVVTRYRPSLQGTPS